jgi:phosphoribosyl 1,2-cyclic phosphodiesterase
MEVTFLGTRGEIELRSPAHRLHSVLSVESAGCRILIDCGSDWLARLETLNPDAVVLTHAHRDHAGGLRHGAPCVVFATEDTWAGIAHYPIETREVVVPRRRFRVAGLELEAFPVEHSLIAPAVGYRIGATGHVLFYAPDLLSIPARTAALSGLAVYVGDGASIARSIVRHGGRRRVGHASIREQLDWCAAESVTCAVFSHCGSQILREEKAARHRVAELGRERGIDASIAVDRLRLVVP